MDRAKLYERIDARTEAIVAAGAREEVVRAEEAGPVADRAQGARLRRVLDGDLELMQKRSRNYARRQLTWMRKIPNLHWIDRTGPLRRCVAAEIAASSMTSPLVSYWTTKGEVTECELDIGSRR